MAGHSKWANIKHRKGAQDKLRGKIFTKLIREITVAAKMGGGDVNSNPRLRLALDKAREANMSRDTITRAIERGTGGGTDANLEEIVYEGYAPGGVAVMVMATTDNRNRTVAEVRHAFTKCGGNLGTDGSVNYLFAKKGQITFAPGLSEDQVMEIALDVGADDVIANDDGSIDVITTPDSFMAVKDALEARSLKPERAEVALIPATMIEITDVDTAEKNVRLMNMLEELDDVQNVFSNANIDDSLLEQLGM